MAVDPSEVDLLIKLLTRVVMKQLDSEGLMLLSGCEFAMAQQTSVSIMSN